MWAISKRIAKFFYIRVCVSVRCPSSATQQNNSRSWSGEWSSLRLKRQIKNTFDCATQAKGGVENGKIMERHNTRKNTNKTIMRLRKMARGGGRIE